MSSNQDYLFGHLMLMNLIVSADGELSDDEVSAIFLHARALGVEEEKFAHLLDQVRGQMGDSDHTIGELLAGAMMRMKEVAEDGQLSAAYKTYELLAHSDGLTEEEAGMLEVIRIGWELPESLRGFGKGSKGTAKTMMAADIASKAAAAQKQSTGCALFIVGAVTFLGILLAPI